MKIGNEKVENFKYISLKEAARVYNCTQKHLNLMARRGKLKAKKVGRNWLTTLEWLTIFANESNKNKNLDNFGKYISLSEAARIYGCTQKHMNLMARQGKLNAKKIGRNWMTTPE